MLRYLFILVFLTSAKLVYSQQHEELVAMYREDKLDDLIAACVVYLQKDSTDASACEMMAQAFYDLGKYDSCLFMESKALQHDKEKTLISCWAHIFIGRSYFMQGNKILATEHVRKSINKHATNRMVQYSKYLLKYLGLDDYYKDWIVVEREHIMFHFPQSIDTISIRSYIDVHEKSYALIDRVFMSRLPRKIDYYIWNDAEEGKKQLGTNLGFAHSPELIAHVTKNQSPGHELTHILSFWAWGTKRTAYNKFVNEGISVAFDCSGRNYYEDAKSSINRMFISSVANIWKSPKLYPSNILYPVSGAFIFHLSKNSSDEEFKSLVKNQTYEHAQSIYGERLDKMINEFDQMIGLKQ